MVVEDALREIEAKLVKAQGLGASRLSLDGDGIGRQRTIRLLEAAWLALDGLPKVDFESQFSTRVRNVRETVQRLLYMNLGAHQFHKRSMRGGFEWN